MCKLSWNLHWFLLEKNSLFNYPVRFQKKNILYDFSPVAMCYNATILHLFFATKTTTKALRQAEIANVLKYWSVVALSEELCNSWWTWNWTENSITFFMVDLKSKGKENNLDIPRERSLNKSTFEISDVTAINENNKKTDIGKHQFTRKKIFF